MQFVKIKKIFKKEKQYNVFDIHHRLEPKRFLEEHPNLIVTRKNLIISNCSRHAGGIVLGDDLSSQMPLISSGGIVQTPFAEGQNVRHLEPLGFIKFDILGLASLRMIEGCIRRILQKEGIQNPSFEQIKEWNEKYLSEKNLNFEDQKIFENVFHSGKWIGIFQFTEKGAQDFCQRSKPRTLNDLSAITSIYRPGPLAAKVTDLYINAVSDPSSVQFSHKEIEKSLGETYGLLIYQEQIAQLAASIGKDISFDEGNYLRKLLTKKGTGSHNEELEKIRLKFKEGATEKGFSEEEFEDLWEKIVAFAQYGFNKSHSISYSCLSYQCAYLLTYHEDEWIAAFLDKETEHDESKSDAINIAKSFGFKIEKPDINFSDGFLWKVQNKSAYPPLVAIKGLGEAAIREILNARPFKSIDDILFNPNLPAAKVNKKCIDALLRAEAMKQLIKDDGRFNHERHCWLSICALERPKTLKKMQELMTAFNSEKDFSKEEKIGNVMELLGLYPLEEAMNEKMIGRLKRSSIMGISDIQKSENDIEGPAWLIPIAWEEKFTKNAKRYLLLKAVDHSGKIVDCKVWQVPIGNEPELNRAYLANAKKDSWGVSLKRPEEWQLI